MTRRVVGWSLTLAVVAAGCSATAAAVGDPSAGDRIAVDAALADRIDAVAATAWSELPLAGMSVAVARGGEVVFADGFGLADVGAGRPAAAGTVYPIGSISKQFTAATVLRLVEDDLLALDDPASRFVPLPATDAGPTVGQLLSHTAGVSDAALGPTLEVTDDGVGLTWDDAVELATAPGYWVPPGSGFEYSNGGYLLAYGVVEAVAGESYRSELERLLDHADLDATSVCTGTGDVALGYEHQHSAWDRIARLGRAPGLAPSSPYNADLLNVVCSTAADLTRWAHRLRTGQVLEEGGYERMAEPTTLTDGTVVPYGLGLQHRRFGDHVAIAHGGILTGYVAMLADFPADDTTVALLVNTDLDEHQTETLLVHLLGAVFDEPADQGWAPHVASSEEDGQ